MVHTDLPSAPAAGSFPSMLVEMKTPYRQVNRNLAAGDVLFLHTDGFEESKRKLRGPDFQFVPGDEDFSEARIDEVIAAVFNRRTYTLSRAQNPLAGEELAFDFSTCEGTVREAVLALVAVEKVYRMVPDPSLGQESRVTMESKVADFLKKHFLQYPRYFSHSIDGAAGRGTVTFTNALEDDQYDDLTIIALRRK